jgi:hypothetical protein
LNDPSGRKDGLSRRSLFARAGGLALGAGALAGCENTTTPVAVSGAAAGGLGAVVVAVCSRG